MEALDLDIGTLKTIGQVAGLAGIVVALATLVFRDVIRKNIFPNLTKLQAYRLLRLIVILSGALAIFGIAAWVYVTVQKPDDAAETPRPGQFLPPSAKACPTKGPAIVALKKIQSEGSYCPDGDIVGINIYASLSETKKLKRHKEWEHNVVYEGLYEAEWTGGVLNKDLLEGFQFKNEAIMQLFIKDCHSEGWQSIDVGKIALSECGEGAHRMETSFQGVDYIVTYEVIGRR